MAKKKTTCRKQHYIPQMLLRGFSENRKQIATYKKNSPRYIANVNDAAAMRDFYSPIGDMSLDDTLTQHEAKTLQKYLSTLRDFPNNSEVFPEIAAELVHYFNIRTKFFRDIFSSFAKNTVISLQDNVVFENFKKHTEKGFREEFLKNISAHYEKNKKNMPIIKEKFIQIALNYFDTNPSFTERALKVTFNIFPNILENILNKIPDIVKDGHTKGLTKAHEVNTIPTFYSSFAWVIKKNTDYNFILPDCVSVVVTAKNALPAPFQSEDENCAILFPLAKDILLVGQKGTFEVDILKFNYYAAENTSDVFFSHPQFTPPNELQNMIGNKMSRFTSEESKKAVKKYLNNIS